MRDKVPNKYVYDFEEGNATMKDILGSKGANLSQMVQNGMPVPPGFIVTTKACVEFLEGESFLVDKIWPDIQEAILRMEAKTGKKWGSGPTPLLVSVRSGAPVSMPGMMDTVLNLGLNRDTLEYMAEASQNRRFALDSYRRLIQMFGEVVAGLSPDLFEKVLDEAKKKNNLLYDYQIPAQILEEIAAAYLHIYESHTHSSFPYDPWEQLKMALTAVFKSWNNPRAITYRNLHSIPHNLGTAVSIVSMVFGNLNEQCGTGVCFTRNPSDGSADLYGEFLINAQGEDVVAGVRTPIPISELRYMMADMFNQLVDITGSLERFYKDMQDVEFTIENRKLYILQTRSGKRSAEAAVRIAHDMVQENLIGKSEALTRVTPREAELLLHKQIGSQVDVPLVAEGLPASPGACSGMIVFSPEAAVQWNDEGKNVILVRPETSPDDIHGLAVAEGVVTSRGGMTSHAAVVARGMGKPCVSGCEELFIDVDEKVLYGESLILKEGDIITVDGSNGRVYAGEAPLVDSKITKELSVFLQWADEAASLEVWANADTPEDARRAREFGAKGIGLCRTEHMFMAQDRLPVMEHMIMAPDKESRLKDLELLKEMQKNDFADIFREMSGCPVIIRLLDPPLHEFLPKENVVRQKLFEMQREKQSPAQKKKILEMEAVLKKIEMLKEINPMMGFRGCRLGILHPEIYEAQICAIFEAALLVLGEEIAVFPEIMIPLVGLSEEMEIFRDMVDRIAEEYYKSTGVIVDYKVGSMIEVPHSVLVADKIAKVADFFSFGTNDLTQAIFAYSRDDAESKFLRAYLQKGILQENPFHTLDREGVGEMMRLCVKKARETRQNMSLGICGEHGGNPESIAFCHIIGLNYVSCSPFRIPVARLAAAQAALGFIN
ncbi:MULTISPECIES: pyruvate, phosphate dikinase [Aminobacterium]|jgi:pyruvate,orthophosphate dikinase|uniref:pyruvate, phosphate dikinase n=1 Tax=Aminobacterium TaxID=81466 RepID=UPI00257E752B|nr:pyruvate, phosphate dikinase [Aminobacterium sp. UBA4987]